MKVYVLDVSPLDPDDPSDLRNYELEHPLDGEVIEIVTVESTGEIFSSQISSHANRVLSKLMRSHPHTVAITVLQDLLTDELDIHIKVAKNLPEPGSKGSRSR